MQSGSAVELGVRSVLETDRAWAAYALADLYPPWNADAEWIAGERSLLLIYHGLQPPILFAHGDPGELDSLLARLPSGDYWYTLRPTHFSRLSTRLSTRSRERMWRMWLPAADEPHDKSSSKPDDRQQDAAGLAALGQMESAGEESNPPSARPGLRDSPSVARLGSQDLPAIKRLYAELEDGPDAFTPAQLEHGVYFGVREGNQLLSVAGTHVACRELGVAALGNVATRGQQRGAGLGYQVSDAVVQQLLRQGFRTIVLNVRMDNQPAVRLYRRLGFMPFCGFYEGRGSIN